MAFKSIQSHQILEICAFWITSSTLEAFQGSKMGHQGCRPVSKVPTVSERVLLSCKSI